jgi:sulfonate transport system substrate-binding protein
MPRLTGARRLVALPLALAALASAACGGGSSKPTAAGGSVSTPAAAATPAALPSVVPPGTELRIGEQGNFFQLPLRLSGQDQNFPYKTSYATFQGGPPLLEAFRAGAIDFGIVGDTVATTAHSSGQDIVAVAALENGGWGHGLVVPPNRASAVTSVKDLKGRKVAYPRGTSLQGFAVEVLEEGGLKESDVERVQLAIPDVIGAIKSGDVDAGVLVEPALSTYLASTPGAKLLRDSVGVVSGLVYLVSSRRTLADPAKVAAIADYLGRLVRARTWVNANLDAWTQAYYVDVQKVSPAVARQIMAKTGPSVFVPLDDRVVAKQQKLADLLTATGVYPAPLDAHAEFDDRFNPVFPSNRPQQ